MASGIVKPATSPAKSVVRRGPHIYGVVRKDTGGADTQGGGQEDGQEDEVDGVDKVDEDDVVKYTILDDRFEPQHHGKTHNSSQNIQSIWIIWFY